MTKALEIPHKVEELKQNEEEKFHRNLLMVN
jgi:hypothetical protein